MTAEPTAQIACASCGGPLTPEGAIRVTCTYCGFVNDVASKGAVKVAKKLDALGIRVPDHPMSIADIEAELAERKAAEDEKRRTAIIIASVMSVLFVIVLAVVLIATSF
jgi:LSD1 subclass zinc finger protein